MGHITTSVHIQVTVEHVSRISVTRLWPIVLDRDRQAGASSICILKSARDADADFSMEIVAGNGITDDGRFRLMDPALNSLPYDLMLSDGATIVNALNEGNLDIARSFRAGCHEWPLAENVTARIPQGLPATGSTYRDTVMVRITSL